MAPPKSVLKRTTEQPHEGAGTVGSGPAAAELQQPLLPPVRTVSIALPTPFQDASGDDGAPPPKKAGGILKNKYGKYRTMYDQRARTTVLVNMAGILERCNEQTLPALYKYVGRSFKASPQQLGYITLACALVQAVASPIGGLLGHYHNRVHVMAAGCFIWGAFACAFALSNTVKQGISLWAFNGVGLGFMLPNAQSLLADYFSALNRGKAFGALYLTGALGGMLGALFATNMGHTHPWGMQGWRVAFLVVGAVSILLGVLNLLGAVDPRYKLEDAKYSQAPDLLKGPATPRRMAAEVASVLAVPSFVIVVTQGIVGSTPWNALVFNTLYLQLLGMSDFQSSLIAALFLAGTAVGAQIGGIVGDWAAARYPNHGRVAVAQLSVGIGVPISFAVYKLLPLGSSGGLVALYGVCFALWGCLISWAGSACTSPIFAEVVPAQLRSIVYSFDRAFEGAVAAMGAPIVGWLAQHLGFDPRQDDGGSDADQKRAKALGDALVICTCVPWALCALLYTGLHVTYKRDRRLALRTERTRSGVAPSMPLLLLPVEERDEELWAQTPGGTPTAAETATMQATAGSPARGAVAVAGAPHFDAGTGEEAAGA